MTAAFHWNLEEYERFERFNLKEMTDSESQSRVPCELTRPTAFSFYIKPGLSLYATSKAFISLQVLRYDTKIW